MGRWAGLWAVLGVGLVIAACSGGGSKATPTAVGTATLGPPATAGMILERMPSPPPTLAPVPFDGPANHDYKSGDTITDTWGILLVDPVRLTVQVWTMAEYFLARPISHDGRWVFWARPTGTGGQIGPQQVLDTRNGTSRALVLGSEPVQAVGVSESGRYFVGYTDAKVALFETATLQPLAVTDRPLSYTVDFGDANFSADETLAAIAFRRDVARATVVLGVDGKTTTLIGGSSPFRWSHLGHKLALTSDPVTVVHDMDSGSVSLIPAVGANPRWSPDDRYVAIANKFDVGGARVFSTSPPFNEVMRTVGNQNCLGDYWYPDNSMRYGLEQHVTVPGGDVLPGPVFLTPEIEADASVVGPILDSHELRVTKDGAVIMQFKVAKEFTSSYSYDDGGVHFSTSDGWVLKLIGWGGKGLCDAQLPPPSVQLPPFGG
jgi:hypothetical protein